jgi:hypothetical protein
MHISTGKLEHLHHSLLTWVRMVVKGKQQQKLPGRRPPSVAIVLHLRISKHLSMEQGCNQQRNQHQLQQNHHPPPAQEPIPNATRAAALLQVRADQE